MRDQRRRRAAFVIVVLVFAERCVVQVCPAATNEDIRVRIARMVTLILTWNTRFRIATVIRQELDQRVIKLLSLPQFHNELADILIDFVDHGGVDRHHVVVACLLIA